MIPTRRIVLLIVAAALAGCGGESTKEPESSPELQQSSMGGIAKLHVFDDVYLSSQPAHDDLSRAKELGIHTIVNLRTPAETGAFDEAAAVEALGLDYVHIPFRASEDLTSDVFGRIRELLRTAKRPLMIHCSSGNRVGAVWLPWRVLDGGLSVDKALAEARRIGLKSEDYERVARAYIRDEERPASGQ